MIKSSIQRCALLFIAGTALQLFTGDAGASFFAYPWGVILAVNYLYLLIFLVAFSERWRVVRTLYDRAACISSLASMLVLTLLFGLIPQDGSTGSVLGLLGFTRMTSSWIFNLFLFYWMSVMGLNIVDDVYNFRRKRLSTVVMHAAFFVVVASAFFGSGDKIRVKVSAVQGYPVHEGVTASGRTVQLPFSIMLKDFGMEEYSPKIYLWRQDKLSENFVTMDSIGSVGELGEWSIECSDYLDMAGRMPDDSVYVPMNHVGATTSLYLKVRNGITGVTAQGWVSCGSHIFDGATLSLPDGGVLVMPRREAKKYLSNVEVVDDDMKEIFEIGVNAPATVGSWRIYQSGYDNERGRWSTVSVLECVRDGWYSVTRTALWLILAAGSWLFLFGWRGRIKGEEKKL